MERMTEQWWVSPRVWHEMEIWHGSSRETCRRSSRVDRMIIPCQTEDGRVTTHLSSERLVSEEKTRYPHSFLPLFTLSICQSKK